MKKDTMFPEIKDLFLLNPRINFLNHGSFGACPRPVFEAYQAWQFILEHQPVDFLGRRAVELLASARQTLANYLNVSADDLVYFSNPTTAINMVARNLAIGPGDEILTTNHEYGAMDRTWDYICRQRGARYIHQPIHIPIRDQGSFVEEFWSGVTQKTRAIFISHITSPTALIFPVEAICRKARQAGILTIVDGAHAPGQIPLDLLAVGADIYTGACHKWLLAPKGAAFLYARREIQHWMDPLVISWGYDSEHPSSSQFIDYHEWQGTRDLAAFLSVPAAIEFQQEYQWPLVRTACHNLAGQTRQRLNRLTGFEALSPDTPEWFAQMFSARLPDDLDGGALKNQLYDEYGIEVPILAWNRMRLIRVSIQGYNTNADTDNLLDALEQLLPHPEKWALLSRTG
jgi:isopenicillin-N epimerase